MSCTVQGGRSRLSSRPRGALVAPVLGAALLVGCSGPGERIPGEGADPIEGTTAVPPVEETVTTSPPPPPTLVDALPGLQETPELFSLPPGRVDGTPLTVEVTTEEHLTGELTTANVGLSFEATDLADERWEPGESTLSLLVGALDRPSLRFGGNAVDRRLWWTSSEEPAPEWAVATVTPEDLDRLGRFLEATDATTTLVVDLGHDDPERAADYVEHASRALGERLVAVSIGNEPNGFHLESQPQYAIRDESWGPEAFVAEASVYVEAIHERTPEVDIIGPGAFDAPWWRAFADAEFANTAALAQHWYPLWDCDGDREPRAEPTVENIVDPWLHNRAEFIVGMGIDHGERYDLPVWMEETGPTSCFGTNETSRTHAQALWTADHILHAASLGVTRMNQHGMIDACRGGAPMSPTCDSAELGESSELILGQGNFLAMMLVAGLREGPITPLEVDGSDRVFGYAVTDERGTDVVLISMEDPQSVGASELEVDLPEGLEVTEAATLVGERLDEQNISELTTWAPVPEDTAWQLAPGSILALRTEAAPAQP